MIDSGMFLELLLQLRWPLKWHNLKHFTVLLKRWDVHGLLESEMLIYIMQEGPVHHLEVILVVEVMEWPMVNQSQRKDRKLKIEFFLSQGDSFSKNVTCQIDANPPKIQFFGNSRRISEFTSRQFINCKNRNFLVKLILTDSVQFYPKDFLSSSGHWTKTIARRLMKRALANQFPS